MNRPLALLAVGLPLVGAVPALRAEPAPPLLGIDVGAAQIFDERQDVFWTAEYRPAFRFHRLGPLLLVGTGKNDEFYAALGVFLDVPLGQSWALTPSFGGGYYHAENGLDLGFDMQFRSAVELSRKFRNGMRVSVSFAHLSNGSLSEFNPGTETLSLGVRLPLDRLFRGKTLPARDPLDHPLSAKSRTY